MDGNSLLLFNAMNSGKCKYNMTLHVLASYGTLVAIRAQRGQTTLPRD